MLTIKKKLFFTREPKCNKCKGNENYFNHYHHPIRKRRRPKRKQTADFYKLENKNKNRALMNKNQREKYNKNKVKRFNKYVNNVYNKNWTPEDFSINKPWCEYECDVPYYNVGKDDCVCEYCHAKFWHVTKLKVNYIIIMDRWKMIRMKFQEDYIYIYIYMHDNNDQIKYRSNLLKLDKQSLAKKNIKKVQKEILKWIKEFQLFCEENKDEIDFVSVIINSDPSIQKGVHKSQYNKGSKTDQISGLTNRKTNENYKIEHKEIEFRLKGGGLKNINE